MTIKKKNTYKKVTPRVTPEDDFERLAERINTMYGNNIKDTESFNRAFNLYMNENLTNKQNTLLRKKTFQRIRELNPNIKKGSIFKKAGGDSFARDKSKTAKRVVTSKKDYIKLGAKNVDLAGYDTKGMRLTYAYVGSQKGKTAYARKINTKKGIKFIDSKGRFVRVV